MPPRFHSFVVLAEMRTGSNFLEASLNELPGVACHGEVFNPLFVGHAGQTERFGVSLAMREAEPQLMLRRMREAGPALNGFRYFHDHDPRVAEMVLTDPGCAKIHLTRNPLDSYLSLKIATATGQWMLRDDKNRRTAKVRFDAADFARYLATIQSAQDRIRRTLQTTGQTAFAIRYDDLGDVAVLNGLAAWLGVEARLAAPSAALRRQNAPDPLERVTNPDEMAEALARIDRFDLARTPSLEPPRGGAIPTWVAAPRAPLIFQPVRGGPVAEVETWLAALDGAAPDRLIRDFTQKTLRAWRRQNPGYRTFTVVRHPLLRAHAVFSTLILPAAGGYPQLREALRRHHAVPLPEGDPGPGWTAAEHRAAFLAFLRFLKANLAGQTSIRIDGAWASQEAVVQGMAQAQTPDRVIRETQLAQGLAQLAAEIGRPPPPPPAPAGDPGPVPLAAIHGCDLEEAARAAYARDYLAFGFADWRP